MSTTRIREKISALVSSQLPEFIQSDFPTFVAFIEAYYRFLEQDQSALEIVQNARSYNDIDRTTDAFVRYFLDTYAKSIPQSVLVEDRFLVKKIRDLYEAKGSELSFKLLFRILFNNTVEVRYPYENVLRASGGNWQQNFSIRVQTITGDRNDLTDRVITHIAGGVIFQTPIIRTKILTSNLTELFLNSNFLSSSYVVGDLIQVFEGSTLVFSGTIAPTTFSYDVSQPGTGFKVGQLFTINAEGGVGTIVKVTEVNNAGGIARLKIISYGYGYSNPQNVISVTLDPTKSISDTVSVFRSRTQGFGSTGSVLIYDSSSPERYFLEDYVNDAYTFSSIPATFDNSVFNPAPTTTESVPANLAIIRFTLGALAAYPGAYVTDQSFISELEVRLQDDKLYQPFAYQTVTEIDVSEFLDIVNKLLNPAGQILYNNRTITARIDLSARLGITPISNVFTEIYDSFDVKDFRSYSANKSAADSAIVVEAYSSTFTKAINNNESTTSINDANVQISFGIQDYFSEEYVNELYSEIILVPI